MDITIEDFLENLSAQFENTDREIIQPDTKFKELEEWDSMIALSLIAMADDSYNVRLSGDDIRASVTVNDLYNKVASKTR